MADLDSELAAFEEVRGELESKHMGQWVLIHERELIGSFSSFEATAETAVPKFGRGPYLIRQVGVDTVTLPASVLYVPVHA